MGFVKNKSIIDNARQHEGSRYVYNIDFKDFFSSSDQARFWKCLQLKPFNLTKNDKSSDMKFQLLDLRVKTRQKIANAITAICCTEIEVERKNTLGEWENVKRKVLPQGAPTSPVLTNVICQRLDFLLSDVAKRFGLKELKKATFMHDCYKYFLYS